MEKEGIIDIDGSYHEGGGQIVRTALALSAITGKAFRVKNIRKGRKQPGLKAQHLNCIRALKQICKADIKGAELGSSSLEFYPRQFIPDDIRVDIGTAGSITLLLQSILLPAALAGKESTITIIGGTDVRWSMPYDFFAQAVLPHFSILSQITPGLIRRGYFPKGDGEVALHISPKDDIHGIIDYSQTKEQLIERIRERTVPFNLTERGDLLSISMVSHASGSLRGSEVAERTAEAAKDSLSGLSRDFRIKNEYGQTASLGSGITIFAQYGHSIIAADALGERGKSSEKIGRKASDRLQYEINSGTVIDSHTADNLIPLLALLGGKLKVSNITSHIETNIYTVELFLGRRFRLDDGIIHSD